MPRHLLLLILLPALVEYADAQAVSTFAGNSQHTANYQPAAQNLNRIVWSTSIDQDNHAFAHYGAPLITANNSVVTPVKTANGFFLNVLRGSDGSVKYTLATDYIRPSSTWIPVYQPVLAGPPNTPRLYYAGAGGTVYFVDNVDSDSGPTAATQLVFYTTLANYQTNAAQFNSTVYINTPITADSSGNIFFGFRVQGIAPNPLNTMQSGFARIDSSGAGSYVLTGAAAGDSTIDRDSHNSAPALSADESTVYVVAKSSSNEAGYLLALDSITLATKSRAFLRDPRTGSGAVISDISTASPTVAPDGDVYFGILANPDNNSRGFLLRFNGTLTTQRFPGGFGWDYTAAIVPAGMVPSYTGPSSYLIFAKYNNYAGGDGDGVNRIALLDPATTQIDPHAMANKISEMREVLTVIGPTPDPDNSTVPNAVREWCINTAAVNPITNSVFAPSEDGHLYRWNLINNSLSQAVALSSGIGEPYVPSAVGPDGKVYTLNGGTLFAIGGLNGVLVTLASSIPDNRTVVIGQSLTFTATVANAGSGPVPTGTVTFQDTVYSATAPPTTVTLATVGLNASGQAAFTTSSLSAANHFITASYSGDFNFSAGNTTLVQKIHTSGTTTTLNSAPNPSSLGQSVMFTATVTATSGSSTPTGMVTFSEGTVVLAQIPLASGTASFNITSLSVGSHDFTAAYTSDSLFASSSGNRTQVVQSAFGTSTSVTSSPNPSVFGQPVTFTATVTSNAGTPTGTVTFQEGSTVLASNVPVDGTGHASFLTSSLTAAAHTITARFAGTNGFLNSGPATATQSVNKAATATALSSSADPAMTGQLVTFTAAVSASAPGGGTPTGMVTFKDKGKDLGPAVALDGTGRASLATSSLSQGAHQISAVYGGSTNFLSSTSSTLVENINKK